MDMFASLCAKPAYNSILMSAIDFDINKAIVSKVYFVPGKQNIIANYLSRFQNAKVLQLAHKMQINSFQPPQDVMGTFKK